MQCPFLIPLAAVPQGAVVQLGVAREAAIPPSQDTVNTVIMATVKAVEMTDLPEAAEVTGVMGEVHHLHQARLHQAAGCSEGRPDRVEAADSAPLGQVRAAADCLAVVPHDGQTNRLTGDKAVSSDGDER